MAGKNLFDYWIPIEEEYDLDMQDDSYTLIKRIKNSIGFIFISIILGIMSFWVASFFCDIVVVIAYIISGIDIIFVLTYIIYPFSFIFAIGFLISSVKLSKLTIKKLKEKKPLLNDSYFKKDMNIFFSRISSNEFGLKQLGRVFFPLLVYNILVALLYKYFFQFFLVNDPSISPFLFVIYYPIITALIFTISWYFVEKRRLIKKIYPLIEST